MESKSIKIVDEHGIDRTANVMFSIDVDGSDYIVYWIERDNENDNIFVSKIIKNIDGTASMINIEDTMEKSKISDIVKELVKYSIGNDNNKISSKIISLPSGKNVVISSVLINKEQNINVQKTYITTVKKAVTKVTCDYFKYEDVVKDEAMPTRVMPLPVDESIEISEVENRSDIADVPVIEPILPISSMDSGVSVSNEVKMSDDVSKEISVVEEVKSTIPTEIKTEVVKPELVAPVIEPVLNNNIVSNEQVSVIDNQNKVESESIKGVALNQSSLASPSTVSIGAVSSDKEVTVASSLGESQSNVKQDVNVNKLVFDGSKESNLNKALGEAVNDNVIATSNVESIREFGVDEPKGVGLPVSEDAQEINSQNVGTKPKVLTRSGFADNKFFMVVAIVFFLASCVFLGYEVFNYFQIK